MSKLNKAQRDALSADDFGDPKNRLFPIVDQDDVNSSVHLIGKAGNPEAVKSRIESIAKRKGLKIPDAWVAKHSDGSFSAEFGLFDRTIGSSDEWVWKEGKIFEAGVFEDKGFELSPEEAWAAIEVFSPVDLDMEHTETVLDGQLGQLEKVWMDDQYNIHGRAKIPAWLDRVVDEKKVSCTWTTGDKNIVGLAIVKNPRITDAVLMSAFNASSETKPFVVEVGEPGPAIIIEETKKMDPVKETDAIDVAALQSQVNLLMEQNRKLLAERRVTEASKFADKLVADLKIVPAERDLVVSIFAQAMLDDEGDNTPTGLAKFGASKTQSNRSDAIRAMFTARPARTELTKEQVEVVEGDKGEDKALFAKKEQDNKKEDAPMTEERRKELLKASAFGRRVAEAK